MYYLESKWNSKRGIEVYWLFKKGEPRHIAVLYCDKDQADILVEVFNTIYEGKHV